MKYLVVLVALVLSLPLQASVTQHDGEIKNIRIINRVENRVCLWVGDYWYRLDLATEKGKASYSLALTAFSMNKQVRVQYATDVPLDGGCDTGQNVRILTNFQFAD